MHLILIIVQITGQVRMIVIGKQPDILTVQQFIDHQFLQFHIPVQFPLLHNIYIPVTDTVRGKIIIKCNIRIFSGHIRYILPDIFQCLLPLHFRQRFLVNTPLRPGISRQHCLFSKSILPLPVHIFIKCCHPLAHGSVHQHIVRQDKYIFIQNILRIIQRISVI